MPFRSPKAREGRPLFDVVSLARQARETGGRLTAVQVEQIRRTVHRAPEAVVKVLPRASNDLKAVGNHLNYISRNGEVELETDDGERVRSANAESLIEDWDLDIDDVRRQSALGATNGRKPPKLVHKLMFSMPPGTPPEKVLGAVRNFAREQFWGQHRYAFALHTDEAHPHVHLVLKAVSEEGVRLNIKKATLRHWRSEFARNLRQAGVEANATERAVRGQSRKAAKDGIYRATLRGESKFAQAQVDAVARELVKGSDRVESGRRELARTRIAVEGGWHALAGLLEKGGQADLAREVRRFVAQMPAPRTDRERVARDLPEYATYGIGMRDKAYSR
jgi:hypothetical protein